MAVDGITIRLLGEVRLDGPGGPVPSRSAFGRTLLALLAIQPAEVVPTSVLIDELWGEALPQDPRAALQVQATRLRKWLGAADCPPTVRHDQDGYRLEVPTEQVDLHRFLGLAAHALGDAPCPPLERLRRCDDALTTYTGEPFTGCAATLRLVSERLRASELHLQVVERRAELLLEVDRVADAVASLVPEQSRHPEREALTRLLVLAEYRAGRQRDALRTYEHARRHLADEYGLEPGPALARLHTMVLEHDPALDRPVDARIARPTPSRPALVERDHLVAALQPAVGAPGRVVVVTGEAGAGKSTLLQAAAHDAASRGVQVGAGGWDDAGTPLAAWDEALADLRRQPTSGRLDEAGSAGRAVRALLAGLALETPVLVTLDDAQLADSMSLGILRSLARLGVPAGVCIAVTARVPDVVEHQGWAATFADLARMAAVEQHHLLPLTEAGIASVLRARLPDVDDTEVVELTELLARRTAGHPLHLVALVDAMAAGTDEHDRRAAADSVPDRLQPLLDHQLGGLPPGCRALLDVLAVAGPSPLPVLGSLVHDDALAVGRAIRPAHERGLVIVAADGVRFRHDLTAQAVLQSMPAGLRSQLHLTCLEADDGARRDAFEVLRHVEGAGELVDAERRATARLAAARAAYARGAMEEAVTLGAAARAGAPEGVPPEVTAGADLVCGLALAALGRAEEAAPLFDQVVADEAVPAALRVTAAVGHVPLGLRAAGDPDRLARLQALLPLVDELVPATRFDLLRALAIEETLVDGATSTEWAHAEVASHLEADEGGPIDRARLLVAAARLDVERAIPAAARVASAEAALAAASGADDPVLRLDAAELVVSADLAAGRLEPVEDLVWLLEREGDEVGRPRARWSSRLVQATLLLARGQVDAADQVAQDALELSAAHGIADALGAYGVYLATRHHRSGDLHAIGSLIDQACAAYPRIAAWPAAASLAAVHAGDLAAAEAHLAGFRARRATAAGGYFDRTALCLAAEAAAALGDRDVASLVLDALPADPDAIVVVGVGAGTFGPVDRYVALAEVTLGLADAAWEHATAALDLATRLGWPPWADAARGAIAAVEGH